MKIPAALYDAKPYDLEYFRVAEGSAAIDWTFHEFRLSAETASTAKGQKAVCVFVNDRIDAACLEQLSLLGVELIALRCAGFNNVDVETAKKLGIAATRVPAYSPHAVAEHAVALLLTLNRRIHRAHNRVREHNFSLTGLVGFDLNGKTAGIVGTGKIGQIVAGILKGFGMTVLVHDAFPHTEWAKTLGVRYADLDELLRRSDVLSLHLPLTPDTFHLFDESTFQKMKPLAYLINTSRGKLIDTKALIRCLKSGRLGGVALDVYEEEEGVFFEDLSDQVLADDELSRLLSFPNVLVTSHQAFLTREALSEISRVTSENVRRLAVNRPFIDGTVLN